MKIDVRNTSFCIPYYNKACLTVAVVEERWQDYKKACLTVAVAEERWQYLDLPL